MGRGYSSRIYSYESTVRIPARDDDNRIEELEQIMNTLQRQQT